LVLETEKLEAYAASNVAIALGCNDFFADINWIQLHHERISSECRKKEEKIRRTGTLRELKARLDLNN